MSKELARQHPVSGILGLQGEVNDLFREFFRDFDREGLVRWGDGGAWIPAADIEETEEAYLVTCDVPGLAQKDLKVTIERNVLTITGERKAEQTGKNHSQVRTERSWGTFSRSFSLPAAVDSDKVKAACKDGVLTVTLPKRPEAKVRGIQVEVQ